MAAADAEEVRPKHQSLTTNRSTSEMRAMRLLEEQLAEQEAAPDAGPEAEEAGL